MVHFQSLNVFMHSSRVRKSTGRDEGGDPEMPPPLEVDPSGANRPKRRLDDTPSRTTTPSVPAAVGASAASSTQKKQSRGRSDDASSQQQSDSHNASPDSKRRKMGDKYVVLFYGRTFFFCSIHSFWSLADLVRMILVFKVH
jgi:hypothetical protein